MEILYLWIRNYKNITKQGFNFGGELLFQYENGTVDAVRNTLHISGFFNIFPEIGKYPTEISNVSGIVGENGTGKTNFLDFLKYLKNHDTEDYILCYKDGNGEYYITGAECYLRTSPVKITRSTLSDFLSSCRFIYLSNILDITRTEEFNSQVFNVSTNFLISTEGFEQFRTSDFLRQITFSIDYTSSSLIDFDLPKEVICSLLKDNTSNFSSQLSDWYKDTKGQRLEKNQTLELNKNIDNLRKLYGVFNELTRKQKKDNEYIQFIFHIITVFWLEVLELPRKLAEYFVNLSTMFDELILGIIKCLKNKSDIEVRILEDLTISAIEEIYNSLQNDIFIINRKNQHVIKRWRKNTQHKGFTINDFTDIYQDESSSSYDNTYIKISSKNNLLSNFISNYLQSFNKKGYLHFKWLELSAGQVARLNIYSRLYYAMNKLPKNLKDVVIIIDEGELYFHPEWQRKWLWDFLKAISSIYMDRRVQIVISTHSPFILSDLPSQNVIFLKNGENGMQVIEGLSDNQLTFASNINMLLSNSFFMNDGLVGEVAKFKINQLISLLNNKNPEEIRKHKSQVSKQLRYIGEPIIRNKLFSMLNDILTVDYLQVQERLDKIEEWLNNKDI